MSTYNTNVLVHIDETLSAKQVHDVEKICQTLPV